MLLELCCVLFLTRCIESKQIVPTFEVYERAKAELFKLIESVKDDKDLPMIAGSVRLAFHDCIGKNFCNGCVDHTHERNAGLKVTTEPLDALYNTSFNGYLSRADFYALAAVVALTRSTRDAPTKYLGLDFFKVGREDCDTSPYEVQSITPPSGLHGTSQTLKFFKDNFNFTVRDTVTILGAHTLGRCKLKNSGFVGPWVSKRFSTVIQGPTALAPTSVLDNAYYREIIDIIPWIQVTLSNTQKQWQEPDSPIPNDQLSKSNMTTILLNSDLANSWIIEPTDEYGNISCTPTSSNIPCKHSIGHSHAVEFAHNNFLWVSEFTKVYGRLIEMSRNNLIDHPTSSYLNPTSSNINPTSSGYWQSKPFGALYLCILLIHISCFLLE